VTGYNTARESFPTNLIAGMFNFGEGRLLVIEDDKQREAPRVAF
jgi:LemA protein